jgi:Amt family ammonium transporter
MTTTEDIYATCAASTYGDSTENLLYCITNIMTELRKESRAAIEANAQASRDSFLLSAASLVFFMQAGFAMIVAGSVRKKNLQNTMLKNMLDVCGSALAFYAFGFAFAFGDGSSPNAFIGTTNFFLQNVDDLTVWAFQFAFSAASATIVAGALAER